MPKKNPRQWNEKGKRDIFENLKQGYYIEKMTHLGAHAKQRRGGYC